MFKSLKWWDRPEKKEPGSSISTYTSRKRVDYMSIEKDYDNNPIYCYNCKYHRYSGINGKIWFNHYCTVNKDKDSEYGIHCREVYHNEEHLEGLCDKYEPKEDDPVICRYCKWYYDEEAKSCYMKSFRDPHLCTKVGLWCKNVYKGTNQCEYFEFKEKEGNMSEFKVGDRVERIRSKNGPVEVGDKGVVKSYNEVGCFVDWDKHGMKGMQYHTNLKKAEFKNKYKLRKSFRAFDVAKTNPPEKEFGEMLSKFKWEYIVDDESFDKFIGYMEEYPSCYLNYLVKNGFIKVNKVKYYSQGNIFDTEYGEAMLCQTDYGKCQLICITGDDIGNRLHEAIRVEDTAKKVSEDEVKIMNDGKTPIYLRSKP